MPPLAAASCHVLKHAEHRGAASSVAAGPWEVMCSQDLVTGEGHWARATHLPWGQNPVLLHPLLTALSLVASGKGTLLKGPTTVSQSREKKGDHGAERLEAHHGHPVPVENVLYLYL